MLNRPGAQATPSGPHYQGLAPWGVDGHLFVVWRNSPTEVFAASVATSDARLGLKTCP